MQVNPKNRVILSQVVPSQPAVRQNPVAATFGTPQKFLFESSMPSSVDAQTAVSSRLKLPHAEERLHFQELLADLGLGTSDEATMLALIAMLRQRFGHPADLVQSKQQREFLREVAKIESVLRFRRRHVEIRPSESSESVQALQTLHEFVKTYTDAPTGLKNEMRRGDPRHRLAYHKIKEAFVEGTPSVEKLKDIVGSLQQNPDTLAYARFIFDKKIALKKQRVANDPHGFRALEQLQAQMTPFFASYFGENYSPLAKKIEIRTQTRAGVIDPNIATAMVGVAETSESHADYRANLGVVIPAACMRLLGELSHIQSEVWRELTRNLGEDTYDSFGQLIETAAQKAKKRHEKRHQMKPRQESALKQLTQLVTREVNLWAAIVMAPTAEHRDSALGMLVGAQNSQTSLRGVA